MGATIRILAVICVAYALIAAIMLATQFDGSPRFDFLAEWVAIPLECAALVACGLMFILRRRQGNTEAPAWGVLAGFSVMATAAAVVWNCWRPAKSGAIFSSADFVYLVDYLLMTAAYVAFFRHRGGTLGRGRFWLDSTAILAALLAAFWAVLRGSVAPTALVHQIGLPLVLPYGLTLATMMTMAAMLWIRAPRFREQPAILLLVGAGLAEAAWEIAWLAGWLIDTDFVGPFYNFGDVICFVLIVVGSASAVHPAPEAVDPESAERSAHTFLPAIATLLSTALIAGSVATTRTVDAAILVGLVLLSALLLVARQRTVRRELAILNRALALRTADARLTELVRRSTDAIVVIDALGRCTFASPAVEVILGVAPGSVIGTSGARILGVDNEPLLAPFVREVTAKHLPRAELEIESRPSGDRPLVLHIVGSDQSGNPLINGVVLTVRNVSEGRQLEREVLEMSTRERLRLARQLHEGLGQDLTGTAFMLQSMRKRFPSESDAGAELELVLRQINDAIGAARTLAYGLSPLQVARGSFGAALEGLAADTTTRTGVEVVFREEVPADVVTDGAADHLFRISEEAVLNAITHSGCTRIEVTLKAVRDQILLTVSDNGAGFDGRPETGLGLRLIGYRARIIGGRLGVESLPSIGTRIKVTVPLRAPSSSATTQAGATS